MMSRDLSSMPHGIEIYADIAIIGGGPAGIAIARELADTQIRVLVVESGGHDYEAEVQALNAVENIGQPFSAANATPEGRGYNGNLAWLNDIPAFELRNRILGGSSHTWIGKCAAFDEIDFNSRPWLPLSGWPIKRRELLPALDRAGELLNLGPNVYDESLFALLHSRPDDLGLDTQLLRPFFWQFSHMRHPRAEPMRFNRLALDIRATNIDFLLHATVIQINLDSQGRRVTSLDLKSPTGRSASVRADTVVLCGGGVENARLLLASNSVLPAGIGNAHDVVGRYLCDHPRTSLCRFTGRDIDAIARHFNFYGLGHGGRTHFYLRGLSLSPEMQAREGLTNCAAYPVQVHADDDPWAALKRLTKGASKTFKGDLLAVAKSTDMIVSGLYDRLIRKRGLSHRSTELRFDVMVEQQLNSESRITLADQRDQLGQPLARIDWKIGTRETDSVKRLALTISNEFVRVGLPKPRLPDWIIADENTGAMFMDMAHPSCTTRMGTDPRTSVVDTNAMVHGTHGLFIAGSSVFPTSGHANPTLTLLALSIRLADHLKQRYAAAQSRKPRVNELDLSLLQGYPSRK
ncbi:MULTISPECIES: GMC family oxidoreductase [unclassified Rhizobium]|uniref:GMC oxidoreductase n=1 Tax=unclassified Rhizobium TaxID=2613769 RepID=UPI000EA860D3|nr:MULTISPECIES: GMC family oxidoreductase [unclassified Rhizobium]AYG69901.1 GMC family oxidoreductase [Rhizobium sp. CCGE531]AYG76281.1 GMC family oxidoreductase [Rhizobium sp. CCGE532]